MQRVFTQNVGDRWKVGQIVDFPQGTWTSFFDDYRAVSKSLEDFAQELIATAEEKTSGSEPPTNNPPPTNPGGGRRAKAREVSTDHG